MSPVHLEKKESGLKKSRLSFNIITFVISILCWGQFIHKHRGKEKPRDSQARQTATQQRIQNTILISFLPWWRTSHANGMKSNKKKQRRSRAQMSIGICSESPGLMKMITLLLWNSAPLTQSHSTNKPVESFCWPCSHRYPHRATWVSWNVLWVCYFYVTRAWLVYLSSLV